MDETVPKPSSLAPAQNSAGEKNAPNPFSFRFRTWYDWVGIMPFALLLVQGGLLGGASGAVGWMYTYKQLHVPGRSALKKVLLYISILSGTYIVYFILAGIFVYVLGAMAGT